MILDDDKTIVSTSTDALYVPADPPKDENGWPLTMNDNVKQLPHMSFRRWMREVPFWVFCNEFSRIVELLKDHGGEYIPAIQFSDCILNFVFDRNRGPYIEQSHRYSYIGMDIVACDINLRDSQHRKRLQDKQFREFHDVYDNLYRYQNECPALWDKEHILGQFYRFMRAHEKEIAIFTKENYKDSYIRL